jgi:hypothetical protein
MTIKFNEDPTYDHPYPALAHVLGKPQADVIDKLYHYVRPQGDYILVRSDLDILDQAFSHLEEWLQEKYDGYCWTKR